MKALYFDCISGASGDMILGALIDAGADTERVRDELASLSVGHWDLDIHEVTRGSIRATRCEVTVTNDTERSYSDVVRLLTRSDLTRHVKERARRAFDILARAEAKVHGVPVEQVHFHEVGALDAIVDIVGSAAALESLAPDEVITSSIPTGRGFVDSADGILPLPAPAVTEILRGATLFERGDAELVTPTGAALLAAFTDRFDSMPPLELEATGYGAGKRDTDREPNVLRVLLGRVAEAGVRGPTTILIETNIDDMGPELLPYVIESLLVAGAQDAWLTSIVMKKGRPAFTLSVLAGTAEMDRVMDVIYRETTTLGVRVREVTKDELAREWIEVDVAGQPVRVKVGRRGGEIVTMAPEHEDAAKAARATGLPLKEIYSEAARLARTAAVGRLT
ncbi:MAG: nickel pincer cofactor biosynthesis protein LarC [Actinomycetota bacterium]